LIVLQNIKGVGVFFQTASDLKKDHPFRFPELMLSNPEADIQRFRRKITRPIRYR